jgi:dTDP-L-rhamnose 4-epimerase
MKFNKILITGGAGFIGSNLAIKLIDLGYKVTVLDNLSQQIHGYNPEKSSPLYRSIKNKVKFYKGDVSNRVDWEKVISNQDAIIHLAAETGTGQSMYDIERYNRINVLGTAILWDILANQEHTVKKVIIASSRAIYGEGKYSCNTHGIIYPMARLDEDMKLGDFHVKCPFCMKNVTQLATSEDSKIHPSSIYGFTKQAQEEMSMIAGKSIGIPVVAFRYQNVYGPGQSLTNPYTGILSIFSTRIKNGNDINIFEDGQESRDFVYIDDVIDATILGLENDDAKNQSFNVGSGERTSVLDVANILKKEYNSDVRITVTGNYRIGDIRSNYSDLTKIRTLLYFAPKIKFQKGITKFVKWVNNQDIVEDGYLDSIEEMTKKGLFK